jgi:Family of unknown function (DUF6263)
MKKTMSFAASRLTLMGIALAVCAPAWCLPQRVGAGISPGSIEAVDEKTAEESANERAAEMGVETVEVLRWKWAEGQILRYRTTQEMNWIMSGGLGGGLDGGGGGDGGEAKNEWTIIYEIKQHVTQVDVEGIATVQQTYESAIINASDAQESVRYNSKNRADEKKKDHRLIKPFAAFVGKTITFRVGPEGKVHSLKGASKILDDALGATGESNPLMMGITAMFRASLSDESMRKGLEQQLRVVPDKAVNRGDTWAVTSEQSMPLVGTLVTDVAYKLDKFRRVRRAQRATIKVTGEIKQKEAAQPSAPGGPAGLMPALKLATLSDSSIKGNIEFSVPDGRIERSSLSMSMTFKIGLGPGMEVEYKMNQRGDMELLSARWVG